MPVVRMCLVGFSINRAVVRRPILTHFYHLFALVQFGSDSHSRKSFLCMSGYGILSCRI
jgi:hypothetical protein